MAQLAVDDARVSRATYGGACMHLLCVCMGRSRRSSGLVVSVWMQLDGAGNLHQIHKQPHAATSLYIRRRPSHTHITFSCSTHASGESLVSAHALRSAHTPVSHHRHSARMLTPRPRHRARG